MKLNFNHALPALLLLLISNLGVHGADSVKTNVNSAPANPAAAKAGKSLLRIADFEDGAETTLLGTGVFTFTDSSSGGKSTAHLTVTTNGAANTKRALQISGKLTPDFKWGGFCGIHLLIQEDGQSKDLSAYTGVQFYARGDGKQYRVLVGMPEIQDGNHFAREFTAGPEWKLIKVPFSKLEQSPYFGAQVRWSPEKVNSVGFLARAEQGATADIRLEVDEIAFYADK